MTDILPPADNLPPQNFYRASVGSAILWLIGVLVGMSGIALMWWGIVEAIIYTFQMMAP